MMDNFVNEYVAFLRARGTAIKSVRVYQSILNNFFAKVKKNPSAITQKDIINYIGEQDTALVKKSVGWERKRLGLSIVVKQVMYSCLAGFFKYNKNLDLVEQIKELRKQGTRRGQKIPVKITNEEIKALIDTDISQNKVLNERNSLLVKFLFGTGVRNGELQKILIKDLPLSSNPLPPAHVLVIEGKGSLQRKIVIPNWLLKEIKEFYEKYHKGVSDHLFFSQKGDVLRQNQVWSIIKMKARLSNVPEDKINGVQYNQRFVFPHNFRSTFLTTLHDNGTDILTMQVLAGHGSPNVTQHYVRMSDEKLKKAQLPKNPKEKVKE